jgi:hypothetical protein
MKNCCTKRGGTWSERLGVMVISTGSTAHRTKQASLDGRSSQWVGRGGRNPSKSRSSSSAACGTWPNTKPYLSADITVKLFDEPTQRVSSDILVVIFSSREPKRKSKSLLRFDKQKNGHQTLESGDRVCGPGWNLGQHPSRAFLDGHKIISLRLADDEGACGGPAGSPAAMKKLNQVAGGLLSART